MITSGSYLQDLWEYNPTADQWTQRANFPGSSRLAAIGVSIGAKGYVGTGTGSGPYADYYEYTPINVGVEENNLETVTVTVFPNPSNGKFVVKSELTKGEIAVYNIQGEKVYAELVSASSTTIDLSTQAKGIYFVQVKCGDKISTQKIVIE